MEKTDGKMIGNDNQIKPVVANDNDMVRVAVIDLKKVFRVLFGNKMTIIISSFATFVLSSLLIVCVPRQYTSQVMLAPEDDGSGGSSLSDLASSFGFDLGSMKSSDAIYPLLYPDLFNSNDFVVELFGVEVAKLDGSLRTSYLDYLMHYQKHTPWQPVLSKVKKLLRPKPREIPDGMKRKEGVDPFMLTYNEDMIAKKVRENIKCTVDKRTNVITISVIDQDPLICATLADSARFRLQNFITQYRTSKARADYEYYMKLTEGAKLDYEESVKAYSAYCDSHKGMVLQADISRRDELESEKDAKFNALTVLNSQIQTAKARIQERTPAFTILQNASVPVKPSKPKRIIFVCFMTFLAFMCSSIIVLIKDMADD